MITLPTPRRRVWLRAFSVILAAWLAGVVALAAALLGFPGPLWLAAGVGAVVSLAGWIRPAAMTRAYELWNRAARLFSRAARLWITGLAFGVVTACGLAGSRMRMRSGRAGSGWRDRGTLHPDAYTSLSEDVRGSGAQRLVPALIRWARGPNAWSLGLLPLLLLLRAVQTTERRSLGGNTYTLY